MTNNTLWAFGVTLALVQPMSAICIVSSAKGRLVDMPEAAHKLMDGLDAPHIPTVVASQGNTSSPELGHGGLKRQIGVSPAQREGRP
ncbi:hypothetical protein, partial [Janthinobacterium lividum]|uniref:hypothetical protein n=1 Tax=Janthinobacterium lividum TaxID=29581 RepID=UPI001C30EFC4